jgi:hypothetical protein
MIRNKRLRACFYESQLLELRRIFEREELETGLLAEKDPWIGSCSTLTNQLYGEPLFLALFAESLSIQTGCGWTYRLGEAFVTKVSGEPANRKRLDGYLMGNDHKGKIPNLLACEVKGWSDHCLGGYFIPKTAKKGLAHPAKGDYLNLGSASVLRRASGVRVPPRPPRFRLSIPDT